MNLPAFVLMMSMARVVIMSGLVLWLTFRQTKDKTMRFVCCTVLMILIASNAFAITLTLGVFSEYSG